MHVDPSLVFRSLLTAHQPQCVASALSQAVGHQTESDGKCNNGREERIHLHACICSDSDLWPEVSSSISSGVFASCDSSAWIDNISASMVFRKYCYPDYEPYFATPTGAEVVDSYITDFPQMRMLAPCASLALAEAVADQVSQPRLLTTIGGINFGMLILKL